MNPKTILYIDTENDIGGAEVNLMELLRKVDRQKYRPVVVLPRKGSFSRELKNVGVSVHFIKMSEYTRRNTPRKILFDVLNFIPCVLQLLFLIKRETVSLIHTNTVRAHFYGSLAARLISIPLIWHICDIYEDQSKFVKVVTKAMSPLVNRAIASSKSIAASFVKETKVPPSRVEVVYDGVDLEKFKPPITDTNVRGEFNLDGIFPVVGVVANLEPGKGHEDFIIAARKVVTTFPRVRFLIVGDSLVGDSERKMKLKRLANDLGLSDQIIFTGFRTDIVRIMACLDLLVLPSHKEPFGIVLIEAMAMEKAVVATAAGGVPEIVVNMETGILVPPHNPDELSEAMVHILSTREELKRMGCKGRKRVKAMFSIERNVSDIIKVYESFLEPRG